MALQAYTSHLIPAIHTLQEHCACSGLSMACHYAPGEFNAPAMNLIWRMLLSYVRFIVATTSLHDYRFDRIPGQL